MCHFTELKWRLYTSVILFITIDYSQIFTITSKTETWKISFLLMTRMDTAFQFNNAFWWAITDLSPTSQRFSTYFHNHQRVILYNATPCHLCFHKSHVVEAETSSNEKLTLVWKRHIVEAQSLLSNFDDLDGLEHIKKLLIILWLKIQVFLWVNRFSTRLIKTSWWTPSKIYPSKFEVSLKKKKR